MFPISDRAGFPFRRRAHDAPAHDHRADSVETQRERRHNGLTVVYDERLSLSAEVAAALSGIPTQITADAIPARWAGRVREATVAIIETLADIAKAVHRTAPNVPDLSLDDVLGGRWAVALVESARTLDDALCAELRRPDRAVAGEAIGLWLTDQLRRIDAEARALRKALEAAATTDTPAPASTEAREWQALKARHAAELRELRTRQRAETAAFGAARRGRKIGHRTNTEVAG